MGLDDAKNQEKEMKSTERKGRDQPCLQKPGYVESAREFTEKAELRNGFRTSAHSSAYNNQSYFYVLVMDNREPKWKRSQVQRCCHEALKHKRITQSQDSYATGHKEDVNKRNTMLRELKT